MIKALHSADFHFSRDNQIPALASLETFAQTGEEQEVNLYVIAGDLFERAIQNTTSSGLPELQRVIQRMMNQAPVVAVTGTPTHDIEGAYEFLRATDAEHRFTLLDPHADCYFLGEDGEVYADIWSEDYECQPGVNAKLLILGLPEPSKEWFLANKDGLSKDEATAAILEGMRGLFLKFAAIRKHFEDLPCLMVFHGEVRGASMCNGQVLPAGGIAVGRDDLAMIGATYYALGHIHLEQQLGDLPAYYSGSAFPVDWGELDQKGFNLVEMTEKASPDSMWPHLGTVSRFAYPHPPRMKIIINYDHPPSNLSQLLEEVEGFQVWVVLRSGSKLTEKDQETLMTDIIDKGALPDSKVTVEIIPTETVRAGDIQEAAGLWKKLVIHAKNSDREDQLTETLHEKADQREAGVREEGQAFDGTHIRIDSLSLRGAIGIQKGTGKDEIFLDLSAYDAGLIAVPGRNGLGKTTLFENLHPWPTLLTRVNKLQDHFYLRDSWRDLRFTDTRTDHQYRALIHIDGANASGSCEYHFYRDGQPLVNGRKADYEAKINELFGSLSLYVRSAFVTQKASKQAPDLAAATQGEKKALFRELAGLEYLQIHAEAAREQAKEIENDTQRHRGRIEALTDNVEKIPALEHDRDRLQVELVNKQGERDLAEANGDTSREESEALEVIVDENKRLSTQAAELDRQVLEIAASINGLELEREGFKSALEKQAAAEYELQEYDKLRAKREELDREKTTYLETRDKERTDYESTRKIVADEEQELRTKCEEIRAEISTKREEKAEKTGKIDYLDTILQQPIDTTCPTCKQELPEDVAADLRKDREKLKEDLEDIQEVVCRRDQEIASLERSLEVLAAEINALEWPPEPSVEDFDDFELSGIVDELSHIAIEETRSTIERAKVAAAKLETIEVQVAANSEKMASLATQAGELKAKQNPEAEAVFQDVTIRLAELREEYRLASADVSRIAAELDAVQRTLDELTETAKELDTLKADLGAKIRDAAEWRYLETAFGPDGIQALELDALAPSIADVANRLLEAAYDARFRIEFRTTRIAGTGSRAKQVEDFEIFIHNSIDGSEQPLDTLSGGEAVWIKKAIYDAFGIIRTKNTGAKFLTVFLDEADGALDDVAKAHYFRLLQAAHDEAGRHHTILITHSLDILEMIGQQIIMTDLGAASPKEVA